MIYKIIDRLDEKLINYDIPEMYLKSWEEGVCHIAVAVDDDEEIAGVAAFVIPYRNGKNLVLNFVNVDKKYRRLGVATNLIQKTLDILAVKGFDTVKSLVLEQEDSKLSEHFLNSLGFKPKNERVHFVSFQLGNVKNSELYKQLHGYEALMSHVKSSKEVTDDQIEAFKKALLEEQDLDINGRFDERFACFYVQDGRIMAMSDYVQTAVGEISRNNLYSLEGLDVKYAFATMFVYLVEKALEIRPEDTIVRLFIFAQSEYRGLTTNEKENIDVVPVQIYEREV